MRVWSRKYGYTDNGWEFELAGGNAKEYYIYGSSGEDLHDFLPTSLQEGWQYLTVVYNGDLASLYVNGEFLKSEPVTEVIDNGKPLVLGGNVDGKSANYKGYFDEIRLRRGVASPDRIRAGYDSMISADFLTVGDVIQGDGTLEIACNPPVAISGMNPAVGVYDGFTAGETRECSVPAGQVDVSEGVKANCIGWKLYSFDKVQNDFVFDENRENATGTANAFTYRHPDPAVFSKVEWQIVVSNHVTAAVNDENLGTVDTTSVWLREGDTITISASANEGSAFHKWVGDIQGNDPTSPEITLTADGPLAVEAVFSTCWFVDPNGNDANRGGPTAADAFKTLDHALQVAAEDDHIFMTEGTHLFTETVTVDKGVVITGAGMDKTIIDRASDDVKVRFFILNHPKAMLENVTLRNALHCEKRYVKGDAILIDENGGTFRRSRVTACRSGDYYHHGIVAICGSNGLVSQCMIDHNENSGGSGGSGGGVYLEKGILENCLIYGNTACHGGGVYVAGLWGASCEGRMRSCTVVDNHASGNGGGVYWKGYPKEAAAFQNVLVAGNTTPNNAGAGGSEWYVENDGDRERFNQVAANCFFGPSAQAVGTGSLSGDPCFVDAANGDFTLLTGSPAMNAGAVYEGMPGTDLVGNERDSGGKPDVGCYEFISTHLTCGFTAVPTVLFEGEQVAFQSTVLGAAGDQGATCEWQLKSHEGKTLSFPGEAPVKAIPDAGWYDVTLTVSDGTGASATLTRPRYIHVAAKTSYLVPADTSTPAYPWKTPETAANDLCALVAEAIDGSVIVLGEGEFQLTNEVVVAHGIKMIGAGMKKTVFTRDPTKNMRLFQLQHPDALLEGVTLRGGCPGGSYYQWGQGVFIGPRGGTLSKSRVTGCFRGTLYPCGSVGIQSKHGVVSHCIIDHNSCETGTGGGIYVSQGLAENCLVYGNIAEDGGGVYVGAGGRVRGCTVADNTATRMGGGVYWAAGKVPSESFVDVIVSGNAALNDAGNGLPEWASNDIGNFAAATEHCLFGAAANSVGTSSFLGDPVFTDAPNGDFTLQPGSAAIDNGMAYEGMPETDLAGKARIQNDTPDIGCYEFDANQLSCGFTVSPTVLFEGEKITLTPTVVGATDLSAVTYKWTLTSKDGKTFEFDYESPVEPVPEAGWYDVTLEVTDVPNGVHATLTRPMLIHVAAKDVYLARGGSSTYPWKTLESATTNLHELVEEAIDGVTIHMADGEFTLTNQVDLVRGIKLLGAGIDKTVFVPSSPDTKIRFFYVNHPDAVLDGVTLKGAGHVGVYSEWGTALWIGSMGGTFSRSRVTESKAGNRYRVGSVGVTGAHGLVTRCIIDHNTNAVGAVWSHCNGLALSAGTAENCLVWGNVCERFSSGLYLNGSPLVRNCTIADNKLAFGIYNDEMDGKGAAGVYMDWGAGQYRVVNCLFAGNETDERLAKGPGAPEWASDHPERTNGFENCFFSDSALLGPGSVTGDPLFKNPAKGDYLISRLSPAHNAGLYEDWMADAFDLIGNPRVDHKTDVDIGCYEATYAPQGTMLLLR